MLLGPGLLSVCMDNIWYIVIQVSCSILGVTSLCMCTYVQYPDLRVVIPTDVVLGVELFMW